MSSNKILALIGAILYSFTPIFLLLLIFGIGNIASYYSNLDAMSGDANITFNLLVGVLIFALIVTIVLCIFNWIAFAKLDGPKSRRWKIYLLVAGIIICVFQVWFWIIGAASGVLFILAYSLNRNKINLAPIQEEGPESSWTEVVNSSSEEGNETSSLSSGKNENSNS